MAERGCGGCGVCCTTLTIDQPSLRKLPGHACQHLAAGGGCGLYPAWPSICRQWFCGWRLFDWVDVRLRPDRSGVLICPMHAPPPPGYDPAQGLDVAVLMEAGLRAEGLAATVRHAVRANIAVALCIPGGPGMQGARMLVNDDLRDAAAGDSDAALLRALKHQYVILAVTGRSVMDRPVTLSDDPGAPYGVP